MPHMPLLHCAVALAGTGHTLAHPPQLVRSLLTGTSQPLASFMSQSANPWLQETSPQTPAWQAVTLFGALQSLPQAPQFFWSDARSCSQPLSTLPSQSPKPPSHLPTPQLRAMQPGAPWSTALHFLPQPLQFKGSESRSASQPSPG